MLLQLNTYILLMVPHLVHIAIFVPIMWTMNGTAWHQNFCIYNHRCSLISICCNMCPLYAIILLNHNSEVSPIPYLNHVVVIFQCLSTKFVPQQTKRSELTACNDEHLIRTYTQHNSAQLDKRLSLTRSIHKPMSAKPERALILFFYSPYIMWWCQVLYLCLASSPHPTSA